MKNIIIATSMAIIGINSQTVLAQYSTQCHMPSISFKAKTTTDFFSDHGVSIINDTGNTQTYVVYYNHELPNITAPVTKKFDVTLENGKSYSNNERFTTKITLSVKGTYISQASTNITLNGKNISHCAHKNNMNVF